MKKNISVAIQLYKKHVKENPDTCLLNCKNQKELFQAIRFAALSIDEKGKKHSHQYILTDAAINKFAEKLLLEEAKIEKAETFHILLTIIKNVANKTKGIGDMLIYDSAERIGQYLELVPKFVYLHAGTKEGAEKLLGKTNKEYLRKEEFPEEIRNSNLTCADIESMLCMFKHLFI